MNYFVGLQHGVCVLVNNEEEIEKLSKVFPNKYTTLMGIQNIEELFSELFRVMPIRKHQQTLYLFEITNKNNEIVFISYGSKEDCQSMKDFFNFGLVVETNINTQKEKMVNSLTVALPKTVGKRITWTNGLIVKHIISKDVDTENQVICVPEKYFVSESKIEDVKEKSVKEKIAEVNKDSTYLNDEIFANMLEAANNLKENYNALIEQEESLRLVVKTCDYEIMDIVHDLELGFDKVSASQGYKITKRIHEVRQCRRRAKDKLEVISEMKDTFKLSMLDELTTLPERLEKRKYRNRNNTGMFDYEKVENSNLFVEMMAQE